MPRPGQVRRSSSWRAVPAIGLVAVLALAWWVVPDAPPTAQTPLTDSQPKIGAQATVSAVVVQAMVAGNAALTRGTVFDLRQARAAFDRAIATDPRYAPAHAGLTRALTRLAEAGVEKPADVLPKAIEAGDVAVDLDPAGAPGWAALARAEVYWTRDWPRAEMHFRRAIQQDPEATEAQAGLVELLAATGRSAEALTLASDALARASGTARLPLLVAAGVAHYCAGDAAAARTQFELALKSGGESPAIHAWIARAAAAQGRLDEAAAAARRAAAGEYGVRWVQGYVHGVAGEAREAGEVLRVMDAAGARGYIPAVDRAYIRAGLGQHEEALSAIEAAVREKSRGTELLLVDPIFAPLRSEARFQRALADLKLQTAP
jgi:tetratricopeptide (TPR) repeat protein